MISNEGVSKGSIWNIHKYAPIGNSPLVNYNGPNSREKLVGWIV